MTLEHMFPRSLRGPEDEKNLIWACGRCNSSKGARRPYEWFTLRGGLRVAKYDLPRIAEGKYLKLVYEILREQGSIDLTADDLEAQVCPRCDLRELCTKEGSAGKLSPLCLDGCTTLSLV